MQTLSTLISPTKSGRWISLEDMAEILDDYACSLLRAESQQTANRLGPKYAWIVRYNMSNKLLMQLVLEYTAIVNVIEPSHLKGNER